MRSDLSNGNGQGIGEERGSRVRTKGAARRRQMLEDTAEGRRSRRRKKENGCRRKRELQAIPQQGVVLGKPQ